MEQPTLIFKEGLMFENDFPFNYSFVLKGLRKKNERKRGEEEEEE